MGKMIFGSTGEPKKREVQPIEVEVPQYTEIEKIIEVEIPKPVTKEVVIEIPKPLYKVVEVEEVVQKPKIKVEEVTQSVIKPVFTIKQETIVLDQIQKKLDETVSVATAKLSALNAIVLEQNSVVDRQQQEIEGLRAKR